MVIYSCMGVGVRVSGWLCDGVLCVSGRAGQAGACGTPAWGWAGAAVLDGEKETYTVD